MNEWTVLGNDVALDFHVNYVDNESFLHGKVTNGQYCMKLETDSIWICVVTMTIVVRVCVHMNYDNLRDCLDSNGRQEVPPLSRFDPCLLFTLNESLEISALFC